MAKDGRVFYAGRAVCFAGMTQITNWASPNVGLGCGTLHVWDPNVEGDDNQNAAKVAKIGELQVLGAKGGGAETGATSKIEQGILGIALDPDFTNGRPYIFISYHPYFGGEQGYNTQPEPRPGLRPLRLHGRASTVALHVRQRDQGPRARFREDHPALHDPGLLLLPPRRLDGLGLQGQPVRRHRRQHG